MRERERAERGRVAKKRKCTRVYNGKLFQLSLLIGNKLQKVTCYKIDDEHVKRRYERTIERTNEETTMTIVNLNCLLTLFFGA